MIYGLSIHNRLTDSQSISTLRKDNIRIIHPGVPAILTGAQSNYPDQNAHYGLLGSKNDVDCKCHTWAVKLKIDLSVCLFILVFSYV